MATLNRKHAEGKRIEQDEPGRSLSRAKEWCDKTIKLADNLKTLHENNINYATLDKSGRQRGHARALLYRGHIHVLSLLHDASKGKKLSARAAQKDLEAALKALEACDDKDGTSMCLQLLARLSWEVNHDAQVALDLVNQAKQVQPAVSNSFVAKDSRELEAAIARHQQSELSVQGNPEYESFQQHFDKLSDPSQGRLAVNRLAELFNSLCGVETALLPNQLQACVQEIDPNGDGFVDLEQLFAWWERA